MKIEEGRDRTFRKISLTKNGIGSLVKARPLRKEVQVHVVTRIIRRVNKEMYVLPVNHLIW